MRANAKVFVLVCIVVGMLGRSEIKVEKALWNCRWDGKLNYALLEFLYDVERSVIV